MTFSLLSEIESPSRGAQAEQLAKFARRALEEEVLLSPKPGLVDRRGAGAHDDLNLFAMLRSAQVLEPYFADMARIASDAPALNVEMRENLALCGVQAELAMLEATAGSNSHRGAIWCLGLLVSAASRLGYEASVSAICNTAAQIARIPCGIKSAAVSHGELVRRKYAVNGAKQEALNAFPHVREIAFPNLLSARARGLTESLGRIDVLLALMSSLDDTCILYRAGIDALALVKQGAAGVLEAGGLSSSAGRAAFAYLDELVLRLGVSPGGSADMLAATMFLDFVQTSFQAKES